MPKSKFKTKLQKIFTFKNEQQKVVWATIAWGALMIALGILLYQFAMNPDLFQAAVYDVTNGGTKTGIENVKTALGQNTGIATEDKVIVVILGWVKFALPFAGLAAFLGIVYAGFLYVANFGSDENAGKAKKIIFWCILGIVVIISAYAIVSTVIRANSTT